MRTTLNLDEDAAEIVRDYSAVKKLSFGQAVSELVRRGIQNPPPMRLVNGIAVFDLPPDSPVITAERVRELMDEDY